MFLSLQLLLSKLIRASQLRGQRGKRHAELLPLLSVLPSFPSSPIVLPHSSCLLSHPREPHFSAIPAFCSHHLLFPCSSTTLFPSSPKPLCIIFINPPSLLHASISFSLPLTSPSHPRGPLTLSRDELVGWDRWEGGGRSGAFPIHSVKPKLVMRLCGSSNRFQRRHYWSTFLIRQGFNSDKYLAEGEKSNRRDSLCDFFHLFF